MRSKQRVQETSRLAVSTVRETRRQKGVMKLEQPGSKAGDKAGKKTSQKKVGKKLYKM